MYPTDQVRVVPQSRIFLSFVHRVRLSPQPMETAMSGQNMVCPKCQTFQPRAATCTECGVTVGQPTTADSTGDEKIAQPAPTPARAFVRETNETPARYVQRLRLEAARRELEDSSRNVDQIAADCGFGTAETMRRTFIRHLRVSPNDYRHEQSFGAGARGTSLNEPAKLCSCLCP